MRDINNIQAVILYNVADDELTVGELTNRGYYLGSNVSYNVRKMVENGYLIQERSAHDRRSIRVRLSDKGVELRDIVDAMFDRHTARLGSYTVPVEDLNHANTILLRLERFWSGGMGFGAGPL